MCLFHLKRNGLVIHTIDELYGNLEHTEELLRPQALRKRRPESTHRLRQEGEMDPLQQWWRPSSCHETSLSLGA